MLFVYFIVNREGWMFSLMFGLLNQCICDLVSVMHPYTQETMQII